MVLQVGDKKLVIDGFYPRLLRLQAEYYEWVNDPDQYIADIKRSGAAAEIFTFVQRLSLREPQYNYYSESDTVAALKISTYEDWWKNQINDKTRNMIRRAYKAKVEVRFVPFDDELVKRIKSVYDETPIRQGRPFRHYRKGFELLKEEHSTFISNSQFIGAFYEGELIGFIKLVHDDGVSHLMQIISLLKHRDKAPTNALVAKAVEVCAARKVPLLHYSNWSRRGLGDFKKHHGFEPLVVPRYFVPLNFAGKVALALKLHKKLTERVPEKWLDFAARIRAGWNMKHGSKKM
jgi:hypothetical protein